MLFTTINELINQNKRKLSGNCNAPPVFQTDYWAYKLLMFETYGKTRRECSRKKTAESNKAFEVKIWTIKINFNIRFNKLKLYKIQSKWVSDLRKQKP